MAITRAQFRKRKNDRISALPNSLLVEILSRLPSTQDAIRTGTLSKRWKHLWTSVPTLIFNFRDHNLPRSDLVSIVDKTLTQCRQLNLNKFEVAISYDNRFASQINRWVRYAMSCNVEVLKLGLWITLFEPGFVLEESFFINSCFTDLTLVGCKFISSGAISWRNLTTLSIFHGNVDEDLIKNILSGSPVLETLELSYSTGYTQIDITSKSVKNLLFSGYIDFHKASEASNIEINAPHILSLTIRYHLCLWMPLLVNGSSLVEANLDYTLFNHYETTTVDEAEEEMLKGLILSLGHVKEIKIGDESSKAISRLQAKAFVIPSNVKYRGDRME